MSYSAGISLFPLLFRQEEAILKTLLFVGYHLGYYLYCSKIKRLKFKQAEISMMVIISIIAINSSFVFPFLKSFHDIKWDFLPLMLHSVFGAIINGYLIIALYYEIDKECKEDKDGEI